MLAYLACGTGAVTALHVYHEAINGLHGTENTTRTAAAVVAAAAAWGARDKSAALTPFEVEADRFISVFLWVAGGRSHSDRHDGDRR